MLLQMYVRTYFMLQYVRLTPILDFYILNFVYAGFSCPFIFLFLETIPRVCVRVRQYSKEIP